MPGDVVMAADGHPIEGEKEKAVAHFYRLETGRLPGDGFVVDYERNGQRLTARVTLAERQPAEGDDVELRAWGAVVRDLTRSLVQEQRLPDQSGVWLQNIRPGGPSGQAEPDLRPEDVLIAVNGQPVGSVAELKTLTEKLIPDESTGTRAVLANVRRDGAVLSSVVELRLTDPRNPTHQALKAWLGASSQPLTPKLGVRLGIKADGGVRLTRIYPGTKAEVAGLLVGDVVVAIDGDPVTARRPEDTDVFARQLRQYRSGTQVTFSLWRDGRKLEVPVTLEEQPTPAAELAYWEDEKLEYTVRELAFDDRVHLQLPPEATGVLVDSVVPAGWAYLAGLHSDDLILKVDGTPVTKLSEMRAARDAAASRGGKWLVLLVQRSGETLFVEISLKPLKT
jgi:serine protease Do